MTLHDVQAIIETNKTLTTLQKKSSNVSILSEADIKNHSSAQIKFNKKVITMLRAANENLQQYTKIMEESPIKSKGSVVRELT
mmetsp:Transcript_38994/g.59329  ORF Transcript_38994/g.59329 Transcript_38994/m.59329 type:complete len:83 (+) Transcript_38994:1065-1313(+)